ncbi:hypothetical protein [Microbulbifer sp. GL-2]|uniref:hypothetical protein n=1 Tax=Microbulbifer sp. GL-2 TaxID=2591606 RepID=UPI0011642461|nr:hypothetical protein [Microbulbifer sp. GL-2]BBM02889.1 hypothetical protein GL2_29630 [Microbulbifer sp. GL-2]
MVKILQESSLGGRTRDMSLLKKYKKKIPRSQGVFVPQAEFGVISPMDMPEGIQTIFTNGMGPCLGILIVGDNSKVGVAHLDEDIRGNEFGFINRLVAEFPIKRVGFICFSGSYLSKQGLTSSLEWGVQRVFSTIRSYYGGGGTYDADLYYLDHCSNLCYNFIDNVIFEPNNDSVWTSTAYSPSIYRSHYAKYYNSYSGAKIAQSSNPVCKTKRATLGEDMKLLNPYYKPTHMNRI